MAAELMYSSEEGEELSHVKATSELEIHCMNISKDVNPACDRSAQGISMSTPILMMTFGVFGNVLALIVLYSSRREAHARRTVFFVMLAGLAWTDLIGQFAVSPIAIITYANNLRWIGGEELCRYHGFMMVSFGLVMPLIVCCMSVERLLAIKFSYYYAKHITRRKAQITFLASWCVTALFTAMPFVGFGSYELQFPGSWCFLNFHRESRVDILYAIMFSSFNIIAIFIMILCNLIVAGTLYHMRRTRNLHSSPSIDRKLSSSGACSSTSGTIIRARRHSDMEAQMIWFLCLITVAFSVCWLPLNVHILLMQFTGTTNRILDLKFIRMASCNQILDPWLYVIFRKTSLLRIIGRMKACIKIIKLIPQKGHIKNNNARYAISNKSFTYEATSLGRLITAGHCCLNSTSFSPHNVQSVCQEKWRNDAINEKSNSAGKLMSVCPFCDNHSNSHSAKNSTLQISPDKSNSAKNSTVQISPDVFPYQDQTGSFSYNSIDEDSEVRTNVYSSNNKREKKVCIADITYGASEPLLDITSNKPKKLKKLINALECSISTDSSGAYYSLDSKHQPTIISSNHSKHRNRTRSATKQKLFLGASKSSSNWQALTSHPHPVQPQSLLYLNNTNTLLIPTNISHVKSAASISDHQDNTAVNFWKLSHIVSPFNIPIVIQNVPEACNVHKNCHMISDARNHSTSSTDDQMYATVNNVYENSSPLYKKDIDSQSVCKSDYDDKSSLHALETIPRSSQLRHIKTRSYSGHETDISKEDFHFRRLLCSEKSRSTLSRKLFPLGTSHKINKNSVSIFGTRLDKSINISGTKLHSSGNTSGTKLHSSCNFSQNIDHTAHIRCFKSKKTSSFLGKNGQIADFEEITNQTNVCQHTILEMSVASCP